MTNSTTVKIPASVTHDYAYGYGYLSGSLLTLGNIADRIDCNNLVDLQYLLECVIIEADKARELDADMSRRADERIKKFLNL